MATQVALYCRLSNEDEGLEQGQSSESMKNQQLLLTEYAMARGWQIANVYCDEDLSGLREDRPAFQQMIADAQKGAFSVILCKTQSRFSRSMETAEKYLHHLFPQWGIRFVTVVDGVDTAVKSNKKTRQINSLINEWYCEELSENIRAVFRRKMREGQYLGAFAPYGYEKSKKDHHTLEIKPEEAAVVRLIFRLGILGYSDRESAALLTWAGIPTPSGARKPWRASTVGKIRTNGVYVGNTVQAKTERWSYRETKVRYLPKKEWIVVEQTHKGIVSKKEFAQMGRIRAAHCRRHLVDRTPQT